MREGGYEGVSLEVHLTRDAALRVQRELDLARRIVGEALRPDPLAPDRPGERLLAVIDDVRIYVREHEDGDS